MTISAATDNRRMLAQRLASAELEPAGAGFWSLEFRSLGSECELLFAAASRDQATAFHRRAFDWLVDFEARFSRFLPDSVISRINANAGLLWTDIDTEAEVMLSICDHTHFATKGAFDATSLPLTLLWDWKRRHESLPTEREIKTANSLICWDSLEREAGRVMLPEKGMMLDFGGVGKEFAVDVLTQIGQDCGLKNFLIDLGGDISVMGTPPEGGGWLIGLENPYDTSLCHSGVRLRSGVAVATSGDYRRFFEHEGRTYGHIIDCRSGWPVANGTRSVSVIAKNCVTAGILSTSCMVLGGREAIALLDGTANVEGCVLQNEKLLTSRGFMRTDLPADWNS